MMLCRQLLPEDVRTMGSGGYRHAFADQVALGDADDGVALPKVDAAVGTNRTSALGRIGGEIDVCVRSIYKV